MQLCRGTGHCISKETTVVLEGRFAKRDCVGARFEDRLEIRLGGQGWIFCRCRRASSSSRYTATKAEGATGTTPDSRLAAISQLASDRLSISYRYRSSSKNCFLVSVALPPLPSWRPLSQRHHVVFTSGTAWLHAGTLERLPQTSFRSGYLGGKDKEQINHV
jgi:hypothetical protein